MKFRNAALAVPIATGLATLASGVLISAPVPAQSAENFYKGKSVRVVIGFSAGGGYDTYTRAVLPHMTRHMAGKPGFMPQNMPGAGSRKAANWLFNVAPKDGSVIGVVGLTTALDQALKKKGVKFDVAKFHWIGNPIKDTGITYTWAASGLHTIEDVRKKGGLICGGTGATSFTVLSPLVLNSLLGLEGRVISGYRGGKGLHLALERGEINCRGAHGWSSMKATGGQWLKEHKVSVLVQWGIEADPEISNWQGRPVPNIVDLGKTDLDRRALRLMASSNAMGRPMIAPPGLPADRVKALRAAFAATMKDPAFLAEAKKRKMDIAPLMGEQLQEIAVETASAPATVIDRLHELTKRNRLEKVKGGKRQKKKSKKKKD
jgi:tripartite-type tricarboxylate transporter receptor subunit TctC